MNAYRINFSSICRRILNLFDSLKKIIGGKHLEMKREGYDNLAVTTSEYLRYYVSIDSFDFKQYERRIELFIRKFDDSIFRVHLEALQQTLSVIQFHKKIPVVKNQHGLHFDTCSWAYHDEGPDNCICYRIDSMIYQAEKLMTKYDRLYGRMVLGKDHQRMLLNTMKI